MLLCHLILSCRQKVCAFFFPRDQAVAHWSFPQTLFSHVEMIGSNSVHRKDLSNVPDSLELHLDITLFRRLVFFSLLFSRGTTLWQKPDLLQISFEYARSQLVESIKLGVMVRSGIVKEVGRISERVRARMCFFTVFVRIASSSCWSSSTHLARLHRDGTPRT